jgi:hypothetical protein
MTSSVTPVMFGECRSGPAGTQAELFDLPPQGGDFPLTRLDRLVVAQIEAALLVFEQLQFVEQA